MATMLLHTSIEAGADLFRSAISSERPGRIGRCLRAFVVVSVFVFAGAARSIEPTTVDDLARAFSASRAMERGEPDANRFRAGRYDGYLVALAEALAVRGEVCLPACFCHVRERINDDVDYLLADPALDRAQSAGPWLAKRLREAFPCGAR